MANIYDQHAAAFSHVSAYVICRGNERVATLAFKFPKDGAGRLWCYFHYIGAEMSRAYAGGYGYDKRSAAVSFAVDAIKPYKANIQGYEEHEKKMNADIDALKEAFKDIGGKDWSDVFRDAGFTVLQAV